MNFESGVTPKMSKRSKAKWTIGLPDLNQDSWFTMTLMSQMPKPIRARLPEPPTDLEMEMIWFLEDVQPAQLGQRVIQQQLPKFPATL